MAAPPPRPLHLLGPRRYTCQLKRTYGKEYCLQECPTLRSANRYEYARVESPADLPPPDERMVDVAILDMNHGWPNLGHDSIVHAVQDAACDLTAVLEQTGLGLRAISFEVRQRHMLPEGPATSTRIATTARPRAPRGSARIRPGRGPCSPSSTASARRRTPRSSPCATASG